MSLYPPLNATDSDAPHKDFKKVDADGDGGIELDELHRALPPHIPRHVVKKEFERYDLNGDGVLDRHEYTNLLRKRAFEFAKLIVVPKHMRKPVDEVEVDGVYTEQYSCMPPPLFMFIISLIEVGIFAYHTHYLIETRGWVGINGPAPIDSKLIYSPYLRCEAWRYLTYMLVHSGWVHIFNNVIMQLFLGILLEMVHKWWRVLIVYFAGVIAGSLTTSITDPSYFLAGASGGVYALITAHMATVIMNWSDMELPWLRVLLFSAFCSMDVGVAVYYRYFGDSQESSKVGYAAHFGGALAGLLIGIHVLKNFQPKKWEIILWRISVCVWIVLAGGAIAWNLFYPEYFPPTKCGRGTE